MARIRTVKPEFFTSESVISVSPLARLLFIGLWCEADREGLLKWKPKTLKIRYLPTDKVDIKKLCSELEEEEMILTYTVDGVDYCEIPGFKSHQVINNRETASTLPPRDFDASTTRESGRKEGKEGKEGKGKEVSALQEVITDGFNHWWDLYPSPRRINKTGCYDKWKSKCKGLDEDGIIELINLLSNDITKRAKEVEDIKYMPTTEPYLNKERWNDGK